MEGDALAEQSGDLALRSYAWGARCFGGVCGATYEESFAWAQRRVELMPQIADPDHHTEIYEELVPPCALIGRFAEALRLVEGHAELSRRLHPTPPDPRDRDGARGEGADGRLAVDPGADAGRRAARLREPRHAVHPERPLPTGRGRGRACVRRRATRQRAGSRSGRSRSPSRASVSGSSGRASGWRSSATSSTVVEQMLGEDVARRGHDWMVTSAMVSTRLDGLLALGRLDGRRA